MDAERIKELRARLEIHDRLDDENTADLLAVLDEVVALRGEVERLLAKNDKMMRELANLKAEEYWVARAEKSEAELEAARPALLAFDEYMKRGMVAEVLSMFVEAARDRQKKGEPA